MAKSKRSAARKSAPSPAAHKSHTPIHYEIDTEYGRLVCDYDVSSALTTSEQGSEIAAVIKAFRDRFEKDLVASPKRSEFASWLETFAQKEGFTKEQSEQELRSLLLNLYTSAAWQEFISGLGIAISNAINQHFEMSISVAKIQQMRLKPNIGVVAGSIIDLVKRQIKHRLKSPHISGWPLMFLWRYYVNLRYWQDAKRIYRRERNSTLWRKSIKDKYPHLPDDLIEWLAVSENKSNLEAEAFQKLPDEARSRLLNRIKQEGYGLSLPSEIALEHAARLCYFDHYFYSTSQLKKIKSSQSEEARRTGLLHYLKNTESMHSKQSDTI